MSSKNQFPGAIVVGLCAHGVGMVRSLHRAGIRVIALEANSTLPGMRTRCAEIRVVADINGDGLIDALVKLAAERPDYRNSVLMLTNDRMVETVGRHVETVSKHFRLSWAEAAPALVPLLGKEQIEARCREVGLNYPVSALLERFDDAEKVLASLKFPVIAKPTRPLSAFKTQICDSLASFMAARTRMEGSMPLLVQEFIPGDDTTIRFGALYLDDGKVLARFEGRKLRSQPMGHTTVAISEPNDDVHELACRFFSGLRLSGPVSLELKRDPSGRDWVIEPTVGRTDFWAGLCAANGVDFSLIEYRAMIRQRLRISGQKITHTWINGERDPGALLWLMRNYPSVLRNTKIQGAYADLFDPTPALIAAIRFLLRLPTRALWRLLRHVINPAIK